MIIISLVKGLLSFGYLEGSAIYCDSLPTADLRQTVEILPENAVKLVTNVAVPAFMWVGPRLWAPKPFREPT